MAKKAAKAAPAKKAKAAFDGGKIIKGIWHEGKAYGPGDEEAFAARNPTQESLQMLANKGVIEGFGVEAQSAPAEEDTDE